MYQSVLFYDNYGRFNVSLKSNDQDLIRQLDRYVKAKKGGFAFYDLVVFHKDDSNLANLFIKSEEQVQ